MISILKKSSLITLILLGNIFFMSCNENKNPKKDSDVEDVVTNEKSDHLAVWAGSYEGTLPCADCAGIETTIILNNDNTYEKHETYLKGDDSIKFEEMGSFSINEANIITLKPANDDDASAGGLLYKFEENKLYALTLDGEKVSGVLAEYYILEKQ